MNVFIFAVLASAILSMTSSSASQTSSNSNNQFTADVYKAFKKTAEENFVICPISVQILLALIHAGAKGKTANELASALHLPNQRNAIKKNSMELLSKLEGGDKYTLETANKIYVKTGYTLNKVYKRTAVDAFRASIDNLNFSDKREAVDKINTWVKKSTHDKINQLITEGDIDENTRAVLLNAIYFKGKWINAFNTKDTTPKSFYTTSDSHVAVDMMEQTNKFFYAKSDEASFIKLPYEGGDLTLTIVLPTLHKYLEKLEEDIKKLITEPQYTEKRVNLWLPKINIETSVRMNPILERIGITEAFTPNADFSDMLEGSSKMLFISKVVQKALIEINEEGTVAAAVTGGLMATRSAHTGSDNTVDFHANRPFIFILSHKDIGMLFVGQFSSPDSITTSPSTIPTGLTKVLSGLKKVWDWVSFT